MRRAHTQRGYYIIEVMIVVLFLAIGLLSLSKLHAMLMGYTTLVRQRVEATYYAQAQIESLRNFQCISATTGCTNTYNAIASGTSSQTGATATYTLTWTVTTSTSPAYKMVDMVVTWTGKDGTTQTTDLTTIIGSNDPVSAGALLSTAL